MTINTGDKMLRRFGRPGTANGMLTWISVILTLLVIGIATWLLVSNWDQVVAFPWRLSVPDLLLASLMHSLALGATFWVWHLMMRRIGNFHNVRADFRFYYISTLAKRIPTNVPYIGSYLVMYRGVQVPAAAVANCVIMEIILVTLGGVIAFLMTLHLYATTSAAVSMAITATAAIVFAIFLVRPHILVSMTNWILRRMKRPDLSAAIGASDILIWLAWYTVPWFFSGLSLYFAYRGFTTQPGPDLSQLMAISTITSLVSVLNLVIPGGLALKELALVSLLTPWMPVSSAMVFSIAYRLLHTLDETIWALIAAFGTDKAETGGVGTIRT